MALGHKDSRRPGRRAFQPTLDGRLETRLLMAQMTAVRSQTAAGGQAVVVTNTVGQQFYVSVTEGAIRGIAAPGGRVSFIVDGSTANTLLEINQILPMHRTDHGAHNFNNTLASGTGILNIASIQVTTGRINSIEGYRTAVLSGPITVNGTTAINRIALQAIRPGGSIKVGGDLNTLDILNSANFNKSAGLAVGRDLNWAEIGGDLTFDNGTNMVIGRDLGLTGQAAKGSGLAGQGLFVGGNFTIGATSHVAIGRNIGNILAAPGILINGNFSGISRFSLGGTKYGVVTVVGTPSA